MGPWTQNAQKTAINQLEGISFAPKLQFLTHKNTRQVVDCGI